MAVKVAMIVAILAMIESLIFSVFSFDGAEYGVFYGTSFALLGFLLIVNDAQLMLRNEKKFVWGFAIRYGLFALCLATAAMYSTGFFFGSFIGLMNLKIAALVFGRWLCEN
jgi:hypothetical protein